MSTSCPACQDPRTVPLVYGDPDMDSVEAETRGEVALAGCVLGPGPVFARECRGCGYRFATTGLDRDLDVTEVAALLPADWSDLQLRRPEPGTATHLDPTARVLVRSYDTWTNAPAPAWTDADWVVGGDRMRFGTGVRVGDTVLYLGESAGHDEVTLWPPARVLWLGALDRHDERWAMTLLPAGAGPVPLADLPEEVREAVAEAADSLEPVEDAAAAELLALGPWLAV